MVAHILHDVYQEKRITGPLNSLAITIKPNEHSALFSK